MDELTLKSIQLTGHHGVHKDEKVKGNRFELDVTIFGSFKPAGEEDKLSRTVDYEKISEIADEVMSGTSRDLIETLCKKIGDTLFETLPEIQSMEVALRKLDPPLRQQTSYAEIRMRWQR